MMTALVLALSCGQFFSQACKQGGDCSLNSVSVTGSPSYVSSSASNNQSTCSPGNGSSYAYSWERGSQSYFLNARSANTSTTACNGSSNLVTLYNPLTPAVEFNAWRVESSVGIRTTVGASFLTDGGVQFGSITLPTCDATTSGRLSAFKQGTGGNQLYWCDGLFGLWQEIVTGTSNGTHIINTQFQSRTIASGVITSDNSLLGLGRINYGPTSNAVSGRMALSDTMIIVCNVAGTGGGNMVVNLRKNNTTNVISSNLPCATASLTAASVQNSNADISWSSSDQYTTTINVSGCTTAPSDCVVTHVITGI